MEISDSYNSWADTYDTSKNSTRDLEGAVLRSNFPNSHYGNIVELGCGTGKNTTWLVNKADFVTALDFSPQMLTKARAKVQQENVAFVETDITSEWPVRPGWANLVTCSLVLEHIEDLDFIFSEAARVLKRNGIIYICELHPAKQYSGSRARFETPEGLQQPQAYIHHLSDFLTAAADHHFKLLELNEHFDQANRNQIPRLLSMIFESSS